MLHKQHAHFLVSMVPGCNDNKPYTQSFRDIERDDYLKQILIAGMQGTILYAGSSYENATVSKKLV
jgi:hypothetical protein